MYVATVLEVDKHLMSLKEAMWSARSKWKDIGRKLGITEGDIEAIHEHDDGECLHKVLLNWVRTGRATINDLLKALESKVIGHPEIIGEIRSLIKEEYSECVLKDESCSSMRCKLSSSRTLYLL